MENIMIFDKYDGSWLLGKFCFSNGYFYSSRNRPIPLDKERYMYMMDIYDVHEFNKTNEEDIRNRFIRSFSNTVDKIGFRTAKMQNEFVEMFTNNFRHDYGR